MGTALVLLLFIIPFDYYAPYWIKEHVPIVEVNHYYDEHGKHVFDQYLFFERDHETLRDWRLKKDDRVLSRFERLLIMNDGPVTRVITFNTLSESWTQYDPEVFLRDTLPKEFRKGLRKPWK